MSVAIAPASPRRLPPLNSSSTMSLDSISGPPGRSEEEQKMEKVEMVERREVENEKPETRNHIESEPIEKISVVEDIRPVSNTRESHKSFDAHRVINGSAESSDIKYSSETDEAVSHLKLGDMKTTLKVVKKLTKSIDSVVSFNRALREDANMDPLSTARFAKEVGRALDRMKLPSVMPMWRHRMHGRSENDVPEYLVLKGKRLLRVLIQGYILLIIKPQLILRKKGLDMKKHKEVELMNKLLRQVKTFDKWIGQSASVPFLSIEEDQNLDFSPTKGVYGSRQWWNWEKRMMQMKVRVKGVASNLLNAGPPSSKMTNFLIRLSCDRNYFSSQYLWPIERDALDFDQFGGTQHMFRLVADDVEPNPKDAVGEPPIKDEHEPLLDKSKNKMHLNISGLDVGKTIINGVQNIISGRNPLSPRKSDASNTNGHDEVDFGMHFGGGDGEVVGVSDSPRKAEQLSQSTGTGRVDYANLSDDPFRNHMVKLKVVPKRGSVKKMYYNAYRLKLILKHFLLTRVLVSHVALSPWFCGIGELPKKFSFKATYNCRVVASLLYEALCLKDPFLPPVGYPTDGTYDARISFQSSKLTGCVKLFAGCCGGGAAAVVSAEEQEMHRQIYWTKFDTKRREHLANQFADHSQSKALSPRILDTGTHKNAQKAKKAEQQKQDLATTTAFGDIAATLEATRKLLKERAPFVSLEEIHKLLMKPQEFLVMRKYINSWLPEVADMLEQYVDMLVQHVVEASHSRLKRSHKLSARSSYASHTAR